MNSGTETNVMCRDCGGPVEPEVNGDYRDWICQDCGLVVGGGELVTDGGAATQQEISSVVRTVETRFLVHHVTRLDVWLQVLEGADQGIRVCIPKHTLDDIPEQGDVVEWSLQSEDIKPRRWRVATTDNDNTGDDR